MYQSSITKFLIASLGVLMIGLFVAALILAVEAWTRYALAGRIARLTSTDKTLFDALVAVRAQIPKDSTALIAQDDPRPVIGATYGNASKILAKVLLELESTDIPTRVELEAAIRSDWRRVQSLQSTVDSQASRSRTDRSLHAIDDWREAVHGMIETLNTASVTVGNTVRIGDPLIAEMVQIRRTAWTIRDRYGRQCSMLRPNVDTSQPLDTEQVDSWVGNKAAYTSAWHSLDEYLLGARVVGALRERIDRARGNTLEAQSRIDSIVAQFDGSRRPAIESADWTTLCDGPFDSILAIAQVAQDEAIQHAQSIRAASFRMFLVAGVDLTSVIAFGIFAVINVQRRLARPMNILTAAIARLSRRDFDEAVPATGNPDELGSMAQALETLRASALEAERLQQAMSRFTADASHQMRTPLTILRTHISVLGNLIPGEHDARASLKDIQDAAARLERLLIQLLKLARADGGLPLDQETQTIDLREVLQEIATSHVPQALEAGIELHFEAEQRPFRTHANAITIHEIFTNLIDNAIRYNRRGGTVLTRLYDLDGRHVVEVEDDGPGIPDSEKDKVFKRFYRLSRDQGLLGSGLGLAIVQSLAVSLNAEIDIREGVLGCGLRIQLSWAQ